MTHIFHHCSSNGLLPEKQSSYRKFHSTETALLKVQSILAAMDKQEVMLLVWLEVSAVFHTIDHDLLLNVLEYDFEICGVAKGWIRSILSSRKQRIMVKNNLSDSFNLMSGVPQGSCLGPVLFLLYASGLFKIVSKHLPEVHTYADSTQLYMPFKAGSTDDPIPVLQNIIRSWLVSCRLLINDSKTGVASGIVSRAIEDQYLRHLSR